VDARGLEDRAVAFPVPAGRYRDLQTAPNGVWWLSEPLAGTLGAGRPSAAPPDRPTLHRWDFAKRTAGVIVDALDSYAVSGDGTRIVVRDGDSVLVLPADHKVEPSGESERVQVDLARIRVDLDPVAEWRQMVAESWRLMRDHFWRADLGGVDWAAALARYLPLVDAAAVRDDVYDLIWELQAELGTSHAYVMTPPSPPAPGTAQGLLGADLGPDADGVWRVNRILPGDSSDPAARSPLRAAGVAAVAGDAVLSVGGVRVGALGPAPLLAGAAESVVELELRAPDAESSRRVAVLPVPDEEGLRYQAWVAGRRTSVDELSSGRVGYLHVPDMQALGWAQIHRDFRLAADREAIVVDVRYNRGGHLSQLVVERLARRVIGWDLGRYRAADSYPNQAPRGPIVFVANQWSGSDGDIVCAAARAMDIGPIIGVRTWGGVVGIDGRFALVDGTMVTQPRYATWMEGFGFGLENYGVDPDIEVPFAPQDYARGADPQLERAVAEVLELL
ncbi:MAG TPA: S41 family peptidase, partial [Nakamurella sp.]